MFTGSLPLNQRILGNLSPITLHVKSTSSLCDTNT
jgi:hypothetical protein